MLLHILSNFLPYPSNQTVIFFFLWNTLRTCFFVPHLLHLWVFWWISQVFQPLLKKLHIIKRSLELPKKLLTRRGSKNCKISLLYVLNKVSMPIIVISLQNLTSNSAEIAHFCGSDGCVAMIYMCSLIAIWNTDCCYS